MYTIWADRSGRTENQTTNHEGNRPMTRVIRKTLGMLFVLAAAISIAACGGSSSSSSSSGSGGVVRGNIASLSAFYEGGAPASLVQPAFLFAAVERFGVTPAQASSHLAGITVSVGGVTTTTDGSGNFQLTGVPAGQRVITFNGNGVSGSTTIDVVAGATVNLINVVITNGSAKPTTVTTTGSGGGSSGSVSGNVSDDDSEDDNSEDDDDDISEDDISEDEVSEDDISEDDDEDSEDD